MMWITTTLAIAGDEWPEDDILDPETAVEWIQEARGTSHANVAFVKDEDDGREVLRGLGLTPGEIEDRFAFAAGAYRAALADDICGCQG